MRPALREIEATPRARGGPGGSDPIGAWLGLFGALSGLPKRDRAEVEEELSDHLRERVRELLVRGMDEHEAVRAAIEELGGAAEMAARFRSVSANSRRSLAMNLSMFGLAGAAAVLSVVAVLQPGAGGKASVYTPQAVVQPAGPIAKVIDLDFKETPLSDVFDYLGQAAGVPVNIQWAEREGWGLDPKSQVTLTAKRVTVGAAIGMIADSSGAPIDYRLTDGILELGPSELFDKRETYLASYDLEPTTINGIDPADIVRVIQSLVESDGWRDNGGDSAVAYILGNRLFVEAPPRYHAKLKWILNELGAGAPGEVGAADPTADVQGAWKRMGAAPGVRRYPLSNTMATDLVDRLRSLVGSPEGLQIEADPQSNSVVVVGAPQAVEEAVVSGLDVAKGAAAADDGPVFVAIEYDGKREVLAVDRVRLVSRAELLGSRPDSGAYLGGQVLRSFQMDGAVWPSAVLGDLPLVQTGGK